MASGRFSLRVEAAFGNILRQPQSRRSDDRSVSTAAFDDSNDNVPLDGVFPQRFSRAAEDFNAVDGLRVI
jgi:hypothetical protein